MLVVPVEQLVRVLEVFLSQIYRRWNLLRTLSVVHVALLNCAIAFIVTISVVKQLVASELKMEQIFPDMCRTRVLRTHRVIRKHRVFRTHHVYNISCLEHIVCLEYIVLRTYHVRIYSAQNTSCV
jgi:hypothetical protein